MSRQFPCGLFQISDLEKEKTMLELEVKELIARHKTEIQDRSSKATQVCLYPYPVTPMKTTCWESQESYYVMPLIFKFFDNIEHFEAETFYTRNGNKLVSVCVNALFKAQ